MALALRSTYRDHAKLAPDIWPRVNLPPASGLSSEGTREALPEDPGHQLEAGMSVSADRSANLRKMPPSALSISPLTAFLSDGSIGPGRRSVRSVAQKVPQDRPVKSDRKATSEPPIARRSAADRVRLVATAIGRNVGPAGTSILPAKVALAAKAAPAAKSKEVFSVVHVRIRIAAQP